MAIIIQNIDKNPRETGEHLYQLRINNQVICEFTHNREDDLYRCLISPVHLAQYVSSMTEKKH